MSMEKKRGSADPAAYGLGQRHLQYALMFFAVAIAYAQRVNLSVCIVDMTNVNSTSSAPVYPWSQAERGLVLSSFFWGYAAMQIPAGLLSQRFGPKLFLLVGVVGSSLLTLATPLAAWLGGWRLLCALRAVSGLCQGVVYPTTHTMMGRWVPPDERGRVGPLVYSGSSFGTVSMLAGAGVLAGSALGWPGAFYLPGALGLVWGCAAWLITASSPDLCKRICPAERDYIRRTLGAHSSGTAKRLAVPWRSILTSLPVYSILATHTAQNFGHWMLLTQMPNYLSEVLHFQITKNGLTSAVPYIAHFVMSAVFGHMAQMINSRHLVSRATSRKIFNSFALYGGGVTMFLLAFLPLTPTAAVALLVVVVGLESGVLAGYVVNHVDLSPNFSGPMMGLTNGIANLMGVIAPIYVSKVVGDTSSMLHEVSWRWGIVFATSGAIFFLGNTVFVLGGRGEVQPWNTPRAHCKDGEPGVETELLEFHKKPAKECDKDVIC